MQIAAVGLGGDDAAVKPFSAEMRVARQLCDDYPRGRGVTKQLRCH